MQQCVNLLGGRQETHLSSPLHWKEDSPRRVDFWLPDPYDMVAMECIIDNYSRNAKLFQQFVTLRVKWWESIMLTEKSGKNFQVYGR